VERKEYKSRVGGGGEGGVVVEEVRRRGERKNGKVGRVKIREKGYTLQSTV
jgi:hypothetical protein